jgi:hypothetical protein
MTRIGIKPASVRSWQSIHLGLKSSSTVDNSERVTRLRIAETIPEFADGAVFKVDPSESSNEFKDVLRRIEAEIVRVSEAQSRSENTSIRIETSLADMKVTQEEVENNARSRVMDLKGLAHSVIETQERHSLDHDNLAHRIQELLATNGQLELSIDANRKRSLSLQEQVSELHSLLSVIQVEAREGLSAQKLNFNRVWLITGALTLFLICTLILNLLILRRT